MALTQVRPEGLGFVNGRRNLIINGAMQVAQRGTSATASTGYNTVDRFSMTVANFDNAAFTYGQSSVAPAGFSNSWRIDCTTVETALAADEYSTFYQPIEAQNLQQIANGSSDAKSLTLSFYVKSNKTGTWGLNLYKPDNTGRQITATYTISSADTWEYKTITFAGDTAGGGIANDNGAGMYVYWALAAGSDYTSSNSTSWSNYSNAGFLYGHNVNFFDSTANDWAVTGVQLEVGSNASDFEHRSFGEELAGCQRYYQEIGHYRHLAQGARWTTNQVFVTYNLASNMRATPAATATGVPNSARYDNGQQADATSLVSVGGVEVNTTKAANITIIWAIGYDPTASLHYVYSNTDGDLVALDAEL
jgi:hypothetical protein